MSARPAANIEVRAFHHTLLWPLLMRQPDSEKHDPNQPIDPFVKAFEAAGWEEQTKHGLGVHPDYTYAEVVYFHPFVRDFLFGDGHTPHEKRSLRRFKRAGPTRMKVEIRPNPDKPETWFAVELRVERVELFLIRPRVAVLMIEVSNRKPEASAASADREPKLEDPRDPLTLDRVLLLQSRLRHIYPPFFDAGTHGDCPTEVQWQGLKSPGVRTTASPKAEFDEFARVGAEPPVYAHWQALLGDGVQPLRSGADRMGQGLFVQQLLDDRMPGLSFIAVADTNVIGRADEDKLPAFDPPGLEYNPLFTEKLRAEFEYTRFRHYGTTYYCNGTSFAAVCNTAVFDGKCFSDLLLGHFRRHYTHMALIAQFQHAALLYFEDELSDTAKHLAERKSDQEYADPNWRARIRVIQQRFLKFRTRSYFTEVSNQIQGKDLFRFWLRHLGTQKLFKGVAQTNSQASVALESAELRELAHAQKELAKVAAWFLPVSTGLSLLAVLFVGDFAAKYSGLYTSSEWNWNWSNWHEPPHLYAILSTLVVTISLLGGYKLWRSYR